jgi:hypothetical protein
LYKKFEDLVDKTALIKSLKEPEDKIGEPSPIRGNTFSHLSLEDFKETGDETFAWESFEKKLSAYSFLKYLVQENDIHVDRLQILKQDKTVTVKIVRVYIAIFHLIKL